MSERLIASDRTNMIVFTSNQRTLMPLLLLAVGLLFSCLLFTSCQEATFVLPVSEVVSAPPPPPPTIFKLPASATFDLIDTVEPFYGRPPFASGQMRVVVGWETVKADGRRGLTFYYAAPLEAFRNDHYSYHLIIADTLPLDAVRRDSSNGVGSAIAIGHLFVTDDPKLVDSAFIDSASFFVSGAMSKVYGGSYNAVIVLRLGDPIIPVTGQSFDVGQATVISGNYTGLYGGYNNSNRFFYTNIPTSGFFSRPFHLDIDRNSASGWNKISAWRW